MGDLELVDVVDENSTILETVTKQAAHQRGLLHKTVISEVIDSKGRWLFVKQSKDRQDAGQYVSPVGGHVVSGETEELALKREANEEVGLQDGFMFDLVGRSVFNRHVLGGQENHYFILFKIYSDAEPILNHESETYIYLTEQELRDEIKNHHERFGDAFHFVIKAFFPELAN